MGTRVPPSRHNRDVRDQLDRYRGREVTTTGDGFLAVFDGAARAVRAAMAIRERARALELEVRAGIHTGEVEVVGDDVRVAVHEAAHIAAAASGGEILASSTTYQLASGADLAFEDRGNTSSRASPEPAPSTLSRSQLLQQPKRPASGQTGPGGPAADGGPARRSLDYLVNGPSSEHFRSNG